jgi:hypothetical protein
VKVKVRRHGVVGLLYNLTIEAKKGEVRKLCKAILWERESACEEYRGLEDYKPVGNTMLYECLW